MWRKHYPLFCWMCQLGTYLERGHLTEMESKKYWFHHLDSATLGPFLRYSTHITYEPHNRAPQTRDPVVYSKSANKLLKQGVCRAFGPSIFKMYTNHSDLNYINLVTFSYAHHQIQTANKTVRADALNNFLKRLSRATAVVIGT